MVPAVMRQNAWDRSLPRPSGEGGGGILKNFRRGVRGVPTTRGGGGTPLPGRIPKNPFTSEIVSKNREKPESGGWGGGREGGDLF